MMIIGDFSVLILYITLGSISGNDRKGGLNTAPVGVSDNGVHPTECVVDRQLLEAPEDF